jgi:hypothetical protein
MLQERRIGLAHRAGALDGRNDESAQRAYRPQAGVNGAMFRRAILPTGDNDGASPATPLSASLLGASQTDLRRTQVIDQQERGRRTIDSNEPAVEIERDLVFHGSRPPPVFEINSVNQFNLSCNIPLGRAGAGCRRESVSAASEA